MELSRGVSAANNFCVGVGSPWGRRCQPENTRKKTEGWAVKLSEEEIHKLSLMRRPIVNKPLGIAYGNRRVAGHDREQPRLPCLPVARACSRRLDTNRQRQSLHDSG